MAALSKPQGNQILQGRSENPIETGLVHALNCIRARPNFREIASTTNEYSQTLAHLAILYDYPSLLRHLVDWCIDLAISDVNGLTALHFAYMKGDLHTVRILRRGGAPEDARDKLGRIPSDLWPKGFDRDFDIDVEVHPTRNDMDVQVALGGQFGALGLDEDSDSGNDQSDFEDDTSDTNKPAGITIDSFTDADGGSGGSGSVQIAPVSKEPVIERGPPILPSPPSGTSISNAIGIKIPREAASKPRSLSRCLLLDNEQPATSQWQQMEFGIHLSILARKGNQGGRTFPFAGYLGLSKLTVEGVVRTRVEDHKRLLPATRLTISIRCYEARTRFGLSKVNLLLDATQALWTATEGLAYEDLGSGDYPFRISLPPKVAGFSTMQHPEYRIFWRLEAGQSLHF